MNKLLTASVLGLGVFAVFITSQALSPAIPEKAPVGASKENALRALPSYSVSLTSSIFSATDGAGPVIVVNTF